MIPQTVKSRRIIVRLDFTDEAANHPVQSWLLFPLVYIVTTSFWLMRQTMVH